MSALPSKDVVDNVALFVQTAKQLERSTFFCTEKMDLRFQFTLENGKASDFKGNLPLPEIRDAALLVFRKLWMEQEKSNYQRTKSTIKQYFRSTVAELDRMNKEYLKACDKFDSFSLHDDCPLSPKEVIDLWLNGRIVHNTPEIAIELHAFQQQHRGKAEYFLVWAMTLIGPHLFALIPFAENALTEWERAGLKPTVAFDHISIDGSVTHSTPGFNTEITPGMKLKKLLLWGGDQGSPKFSAFWNFSNMLQWDDGKDVYEHDMEKLFTLIQKATSVKELVELAGFQITELTREAILAAYDEVSGGTFGDEIMSAQKRIGRFSNYDGNKLAFHDDALAILENQFARIKKELKIQ